MLKRLLFYDQLQDTGDDVPSCDIKLHIGDINAKQDNKRKQCLEHVIGPCGSASQISNNGECLLLFCSINNLCIRHTYFVHSSIHKKTWQSPDGSPSIEINYFHIGR